MTSANKTYVIAAMIALVIATGVHLQEQNVQEREATINADWKEMTASMEKMHAAVISMLFTPAPQQSGFSA
jgi:hypothetical protein